MFYSKYCYLEFYILLKFQFVRFLVVDCDWSFLRRAAQRIGFWQSRIHLVTSSLSLTFIQINLKVAPDSSSHAASYKQTLFLQKALFVLQWVQSMHIPLKMIFSLEANRVELWSRRKGVIGGDRGRWGVGVGGGLCIRVLEFWRL